MDKSKKRNQILQKIKHFLADITDKDSLPITLVTLFLVIVSASTFAFILTNKTVHIKNPEAYVPTLSETPDTGESKDTEPDKEEGTNKDKDDTETTTSTTATADEYTTTTSQDTSDSQNGSETDPSPDPDPIPDPDPEPEPEPEPEVPSAIVAFYADSQSDTDQDDANHQVAVNNILNSGANPIFHAGDLMEDGTQDSLDRFNSVTATLRSSRTFYAAPGNNDRKVGDSSTISQLWLDNFTFPNNEQWYSVNYGNLHVIVLDSAFSSSSPTQLSWLASDLQSTASQSRITCVMYHHPTFNSSISSYLVNYGADFVVAGHYHSYSHSTSNGIHYFVMSGQPSIGYMKAKIYENHVEITSYNSGNAVIDTVEFNDR